MGKLHGGRRLQGPAPSRNMDEQIWRAAVTQHGNGTPSRAGKRSVRATRLNQKTGTGTARRQGGSL